MGQTSARRLSLSCQTRLKGRGGAATLVLTGIVAVALGLVAPEVANASATKSTAQERLSWSSRRIMPAPCPSISSMDSRRRFLIGRRSSTGSLTARRPPISFDRMTPTTDRKKRRGRSEAVGSRNEFEIALD